MPNHENFILAIDQGTSGTKALLVNKKGEIVAQAYREAHCTYPQPGWVEQDPEQLWESVRSAINGALEEAWISPDRIAGIGITNQRETTILWEKNSGKPAHPAIVWQCRRSAAICEQLRRRGLSREIQKTTGLVIDPYFSATKIKWLLQNVKGLQKMAEAREILFGTVDTWLCWKLSGGQAHITDYTNASRTMLFDIHSLSWSQNLLNRMKIPRVILPRVVPSSGLLCRTAMQEGVGEGVPIAGIAGDQQAALFGQCCFERGMAKCTYGTGGFLLMCTGKKAYPSSLGLLTTVACGKKGEPVYALEGSIFSAGSALQWLRDKLNFFEQTPESEALARRAGDTGGVYLVPAFSGLGAPYWDSQARGAILGLTRGTTKEHITRAALESIAYQTADVLQAMEKDGRVKVKELRVDGGAAANNFLLQFQADLLGLRISRPRGIETTSLGAAYLAGLATEFWKDARKLEASRKVERNFTPTLSKTERKARYDGWRRAVQKVLESKPRK